MVSDGDIIQAIKLAEAGRCTEALLQLHEMTQRHPADFRPWWAIANLDDDPAQTRGALEHVLALKPDQHEAHELLALLERNPRKRRVVQAG